MLYQNNTPGLQASLTEVPLLEPGKTAVWVDDQVQAPARPAAPGALGEGEATDRCGAPQLEVGGRPGERRAGAEASESGTVANRSAVPQQNLVVYALARRGAARSWRRDEPFCPKSPARHDTFQLPDRNSWAQPPERAPPAPEG